MAHYGNSLKVAGSRDAQKYFSKAKKVIDGAASDLDSYTTKMTHHVAAFKIELPIVLELFSAAYIFSREQLSVSKKDKKELLEGTAQFVGTMESAVTEITALQESVIQIPPLTTKLRKSQRRAAAMLGELIAEIRIATEKGKAIIDRLNG